MSEELSAHCWTSSTWEEQSDRSEFWPNHSPPSPWLHHESHQVFSSIVAERWDHFDSWQASRWSAGFFYNRNPVLSGPSKVKTIVCWSGQRVVFINSHSRTPFSHRTRTLPGSFCFSWGDCLSTIEVLLLLVSHWGQPDPPREPPW